MTHGPYINLGEGRKYHFLAPDERVLDIETMADSLSRTCRFNGRLGWLTVLEHSVGTSHIVAPRHAFDALMHDMHESVVQDIVSPLQFALPDYPHIEACARYAVHRRYGNAFHLPDEVKIADLAMRRCEALALGVSVADLAEWNLPPDVPIVRYPIRKLAPRAAKAQFLARFRQLTTPGWQKGRRA